MAFAPYAVYAAEAIGTAATVAGAIQSSRAQSQAEQYQAAVSRNNQTVAEQNAQLALQQGQQQEAAKRQQTAQTEGRIGAMLSAEGVDPTFGTALRLQSDTAKLG